MLFNSLHSLVFSAILIITDEEKNCGLPTQNRKHFYKTRLVKVLFLLASFIGIFLDIALKYAVSIADSAKKIELLINSLPAEETSLEVQDEATKQLLSEYRKESAKLFHLITGSFQTRLSKVRGLLSRISETQLLTRSLESEVCFAYTWLFDTCRIPMFDF